MTTPRPVTRTLSNGVHVTVLGGYPAPRAAVAVHVPVGFRDEEPGEEGMAHFFEHMMFRGSEGLPRGSFGDEVYETGGSLSGTTHHDYTEYVQVVPADQLRRALFRDADRLRAPLFEADEIALQLQGVVQEVTHARDLPVLGGFPWPLVSAAAFTTDQNRHDGYGDLGDLARTDRTRCLAFFDRHYMPEGINVTVVCPQQWERALEWAAAEFGRIAPRGRRMRRRSVEPPPDRAGGDTWCSPGLDQASTAVALRLPDPLTDPQTAVATLVLAGIMSAEGVDIAGHHYDIQASCGIFGAFDTLDPDLMTITVAADPQRSADVVAQAFITELGRRARSSTPRSRAAAVSRTVTDLRRELDGISGLARQSGRARTLFGRADWPFEIADRVQRVTDEQVRDAAKRLSGEQPRWVRVEPGARRTRPGQCRPVVVPVAARQEGRTGSPERLPAPVAEAGRADVTCRLRDASWRTGRLWSPHTTHGRRSARYGSASRSQVRDGSTPVSPRPHGLVQRAEPGSADHTWPVSPCRRAAPASGLTQRSRATVRTSPRCSAC